MFAALLLLTLTGVAIFMMFNYVTRRLIGRWHAMEN
jgi:NitT/TauT family transport system permease protein